MARRADNSAGKLERDLSSGKVRGVYLLFGKEGYLIGQLRRRLEEAALQGGLAAFNRSVFNAAKVKPEEIDEAIRMVPMMGGRRLVVVERIDQADKKTTKALMETLTRIIQARVPSSVLLMTTDKVDRRRKFYKAVVKEGLAVECKPLWSRALQDWVTAEARSMGKRIDHAATRLLEDMVGNDLGKLHNELEKLAQFVGERPSIRLEDAEQSVADLKLSTVYDLNDALGRGNLAPALLALAKLAEAGTAPDKTMWFINNHFRMLLQARDAQAQGKDPAEVLMANRVPRNMVWKYEPQIHVRDVPQLRRALVRIGQTADDLRRAKIPAQLLLDQLVLDLCGTDRRARPAAR